MKYLSKLLSMLLIGSMLCTVGCKKYDDDIKSLNNRVDKIEGSLNDQISPLKTDLEAVKAQLEKLVADTEKLTANHKADLDALKEADKKLEEGLKKNIEDALKEFADDIKALETLDAAFKTQLANIETNVAKNSGEITKVSEALAEYKVLVDAKILEYESRIAKAEETLKDIEENVIPAFETQIAANETNIESILTTIDLMKDADAKTETLLTTLGEDIQELTDLYNTISEQYDKCLSDVLRVENEMNAKLDAEMLEIEALREALKSTNGDLAYLKATVDANYDELSKKVDAVKNHLEEYKAVVTKEIEDAVNAAIDVITIDITAIQDKLSDLNKMYNELLSDFNSFKEETNKRLTSIEESLEAINNQLANMVQNITFVPEFNDDYATAVRVFGPKNEKGEALCATTLTAMFDITPASAANAVVTNGCVVVEPLKTRGIALKDESLVVEVVDEAKGRVKVTAFVPNMTDEYDTYAFTLNIAVEDKLVSSSDYVHIYQNEKPEYHYVLVSEEGNESIKKHANWDANRDALSFDKKWTKASEEAVNALEGYVFKLTNNKEYYALEEIEAKFGMTTGALAVSLEPNVVCGEEYITVDQNANIDMFSADECEMYPYIGQEAKIEFKATNNSFLDIAFDAYFNISGVKPIDNTFTVEEAGDLYWLSQNQNFLKENNCTIEFKEGVELDMAAYCNSELEKFEPIANATTKTTLTVNGNGATVKSLTIEGNEHVGLFGYVKGNINDINVVDSKIVGHHWVGGVVAAIHGSITNCHVDNCEISATPNSVAGAWDNGDKVGGIVGYSAPDGDATVSTSYAIANCSVKNTNISAFRDVAGIAGYFNFGGDNLNNNTVENVNVLAVQRESKTPGYYKDANIGRVIGRCDIAGAYAEKDDKANTAVNTDIRVLYAEGAELNVNSFEASEHRLEISSANGLAWFSNHVTDANYCKNYNNVVIVKDIDFGGELYFEADDVTFEPINNWVGTKYHSFNFDGNNKTISNFTFEQERKDIALFGSYVGDIKNVRMENVTLKGWGRVAPIAAQLWGDIDNCHVSNLKISVYQNDEDGDKLGGIVAQMQDPNTITKCSVTNADIEGYRDLGGIAGMANIASWDGSNKLTNVNIWINQTHDGYDSVRVPFENESAYVGRQTGEKVQLEANGAAVYNILDANLYRRYVQTRSGQLRLGYETYTAKENAEALWMFASNYASYNDVFQVTEMELTETWSAIGTASKAFKGTYNGNGMAIRGLEITNYNQTPSGLFGYVIGTLTGVNVVEPKIYGSHYAGAVVAHMFGTVSNCRVEGGEIIIMPNYVDGRFDNGDKAGALVGYLAASGVGSDKIINNTVVGVRVKAYRDVAALVGCANVIADMSGNTIENCSIVADQITGKYPENDPKDPNIGMLIGRLTSEDASKVNNNIIKNSKLGQLVQKDGALVTEVIETVQIGSIGK